MHFPTAPVVRADFRTEMPDCVTVHRFEHLAETRAAEAGTSAGGSGQEPNMAAMTEEEQLAYALSLSMLPEQPKADNPAAQGEETAAEAGPAEVAEDGAKEEPLFDTHHEPGVSGHVSLRPAAFMRVKLGDTVPIGVEAQSASPAPAAPAAAFGGSSFGVAAHTMPYGGKSGGGFASNRMHHCWTISMDIRLSALPESDPIPLLSCSADTGASKGTSELFVYPTGAVTVFDEEPTDPRTLLKPGQWTRVTVRFGKTSESKDKRVLSVFINGKASITDLHKYDFRPNGGRFAIPMAGFLLFAGKDPGTMPGIDVRYVEFTNRCLSDTEVRVGKSQSIYRQFKQAAPDDDIRRSLALQPL